MVALFLSLFFGFTPRREGPKDGRVREVSLAPMTADFGQPLTLNSGVDDPCGHR